MFEYKTELIDTSIKWGLDDSASENDITKLDNILNERAKDGWELAAYSYMPNTFGFKSVYSVTLRRKAKKED